MMFQGQPAFTGLGVDLGMLKSQVLSTGGSKNLKDGVMPKVQAARE